MKSMFWMLLLIVLGSGHVFGEIYQWRDAQGKLHFGDRPRTADAKPVELKNTIGSNEPKPPDEDQLEQQRRLLKAFDKKHQRKKEATAKAVRDRAQTRRQCNRARQTLASYRSSGRIFSEDAKGNRSYYSNEEREAKINRLQRLVDQHCR